MKKTVFVLMSVFALTACNNTNDEFSQSNNEQSEAEEVTSIGGEKDEKGCLVGAGETWSQLKQNCIQIFNEGQRLNPIETQEGEAVISAFVLFNDDKSEIELFLPETKSTTILKTTNQEVYENGDYKFETKGSSLYINGVKVYTAESAQ